MSESASSRAERDAAGRFQPGNTTSKKGGNPSLRRLGELQTAVRAAASPEAVAAVLEALHVRALAGDCASASVWLGRVLGPARAVVDVELPAVVDAPSASEAFQRIVEAAAAGRLDVDAAERLASLTARAAEANAWRDLAERVAALEALPR
jgi:hypothetical protein